MWVGGLAEVYLVHGLSLCLCVLATEGNAQWLSKAYVPPWAGLGSDTTADMYLSSEPGSWRMWPQQRQRSRLLWPKAEQRRWLEPRWMTLMDHQVGDAQTESNL